MISVGLDGFRKGWVAVGIAGDRREIHFLAAITELLDRPFDRVAIDIPIGLPDSGDRRCDLEARRRLRPHASRIFTGARRGLWDFASAAAANTALHARGEAGMSLQLWHLGPKILEIDGFVRKYPQRDIREVHPELVFLRLNGGKPLAAKTSAEGFALRRALLLAQGFSEIDEWITATRRGTGAKADDVLDACAAAVAARDFDQGFCLPDGDAPRDACAVRMQIWY